MSLDSARMPSLGDKIRTAAEVKPEVTSDSVEGVETVEKKKVSGRRLNK